MSDTFFVGNDADNGEKRLPVMERHFHRPDYRNGMLTVHFTDAAHLADSWNYAERIGKGVEFERAIMKLLRVALGSALPNKKTGYESKPGFKQKITISPDAHDQPSFAFHETVGLIGGLIFHPSSMDWRIHT